MSSTVPPRTGVPPGTSIQDKPVHIPEYEDNRYVLGGRYIGSILSLVSKYPAGQNWSDPRDAVDWWPSAVDLERMKLDGLRRTRAEAKPFNDGSLLKFDRETEARVAALLARRKERRCRLAAKLETLPSPVSGLPVPSKREIEAQRHRLYRARKTHA